MPSQILPVESYADIIKGYNPKNNLSINVLTKYEKTKIIGMRLQQLANGADPCVETTKKDDIRSIALRELEERKLPFMIGRALPNGKKEYYKLEDMII